MSKQRLSFFAGILAILNSSLFAAPFKYQDLVGLIRDNQVKTIDRLLPLIPEGYRSHYTFVYRSRSSQQLNVFFDQPRVILYGDDATFIMAFAKDPNAPPQTHLADTLETIEFQEDAARFVFRSLTFDGVHDPLDPEPEINPSSCLACHHRDPRPNW